jgi:hypothetical protein
METRHQRAGGVRLLIPRAYIQAWSAKAPWPDLRQVEPDLIICRALCDLFNATALKGEIATPAAGRRLGVANGLRGLSGAGRRFGRVAAKSGTRGLT